MKKIVLVLSFLLSSPIITVNKSCDEEDLSQYEENEIITVTKYKIVGTDYYRSVEKFVIEDHEYLVFGSKMGNPPTVIHSESCPCKSSSYYE